MIDDKAYYFENRSELLHQKLLFYFQLKHTDMAFDEFNRDGLSFKTLIGTSYLVLPFSALRFLMLADGIPVLDANCVFKEFVKSEYDVTIVS